MDEGEEEEEEELDHANIIAQYGGFNDVAMGRDNEEEVAAEDDRGDDAFGDAIRNAQRECESEKEKAKFERMLEDHRKSLYPTTKEEQKKLGTTLELLQWKAKNGMRIWMHVQYVRHHGIRSGKMILAMLRVKNFIGRKFLPRLCGMLL